MQGESSEPVVQVRGAWHGEVGDPGRNFAGVVLTSELPDVRPGARVAVLYRAPGSRQTQPHEHGLYVMQVGGRDLGLMRFTCQDTGMTGREGNDDTAEATWQALILPGEPPAPLTGPGG